MPRPLLFKLDRLGSSRGKPPFTGYPPPPVQASAAVTFTAPDPAGGVQTGGSALVSKGKAVTGTGGLQAAGAATLSKDKAFAGTGGMLLAGVADVAKGKCVAGAGGALAGGSAETSKAKAVSGAGGLQSDGVARLAITKASDGAGGLLAAGGAAATFVQAPAPVSEPPGAESPRGGRARRMVMSAPIEDEEAIAEMLALAAL